jgi:hypothetical protein
VDTTDLTIGQDRDQATPNKSAYAGRLLSDRQVTQIVTYVRELQRANGIN